MAIGSSCSVRCTGAGQIQRLIATGFSLDDSRGFPDCMRLVEGAQMCPETAHTHRARLQLIERQLADLERRRARLLATLAQGAAAATSYASQTTRKRARQKRRSICLTRPAQDVAQSARRDARRRRVGAGCRPPQKRSPTASATYRPTRPSHRAARTSRRARRSCWRRRSRPADTATRHGCDARHRAG